MGAQSVDKSSCILPPEQDGTHETTPEHPIRIQEPFKTRIIRLMTWIFVSSAVSTLPMLTILCFIPFVGVLVVPVVACIAYALVFGISHLAHLLLAQEDAPPRRSLPFLTWEWSRCFRVTRSVLLYLRQDSCLLATFVADWLHQRVARPTVISSRAIDYGSPRFKQRLDVYAPLYDDHHKISRIGTPIIVFLPPQLRFLPRGRSLFASLGRNMSLHVGCVVVIPDISTYPTGGRLPQQVEDTRHVLHWLSENASRYGGDSKKVYLCGHGLSGLLALLVPIQQGVVRARDTESLFVGTEEPIKEVPNGIKDLRIYASDVDTPEIAGVIAFAPIVDVDRHIVHESRQGVHNISFVRRVCGPTQKISLQHSPSHLIYASRSFNVKSYLPERFLVMHGGLDESVEYVQSEIMKELLRGIGVSMAKLSVFAEVGHWEVVQGLMGQMRGSSTRAVLDQLYSFVHD